MPRQIWIVTLSHCKIHLGCSENSAQTNEQEFENLQKDLAKNFHDPKILQPPTSRLLQRRIEWMSSRNLLLQVWPRNANRQSWSISHTRGACAVAVCVAESCVGVGVDIEKQDRYLSPGLRKKITSLDENIEALSTLDLWMMKEACFKARGSGGVISEFVVKTVAKNPTQPQALLVDQNKMSFEAKIFPWRDWRVAWSVVNP